MIRQKERPESRGGREGCAPNRPAGVAHGVHEMVGRSAAPHHEVDPRVDRDPEHDGHEDDVQVVQFQAEDLRAAEHDDHGHERYGKA